MSDTTTAVPRTAIQWFEIQCADLDRAATFYETLLGTKLRRETYGDPMVIFPYDTGGTGGTLVKRSMQRPGPLGTLVYLNCNGQLDETIARVATSGGLILQPKTAIVGGFGHYACIRDSEGNHVGLHSV